MRIICCWDISICAVSPITAQMWIKPVILTKKCHNCILKMHHTIFYQINWICKQKSSMSKKYSHLRSSCTNTNIFLGKHDIKDCMHYSDRICQFSFLFINESIQRCNPSEKSIFVQFHKILPKCKKNSSRKGFCLEIKQV